MLNLKNILEKENDKKLKKDKWVLRSILIGLISLIIALAIFWGIIMAEKYIYMNMVKESIITEITSMVNLNKDIQNKKGEIKIVANFELEKDTLPFKNFRTSKSPGGNCEGYSMYELLKFEGKLKEFLGDNINGSGEEEISELEFSDKDIDNIYNVAKDDMINYYYNYDALEGRKINYEGLLKKAYGFDREKETKIKSDFNAKEFDNKELKNILKDIEYIHSNKKYTIYETNPYYTTNPKENKNHINSKYSFGDIDFIKSNIDNDKLIEIAISNSVSGHSLLAYGYDRIDENNYKVYVNDSNIPIIKKDNLTPEDEKVNEDIKNNFYILFTKDILQDQWSYIYQPSINGNELYGYFNSFLPGTKLSIYSTGL